MIILDRLSKNSIFFIRPILFFGKKIFYYKKDHNINTSIDNLIPLSFNRKYAKSRDLIKKWNIGDEEFIDQYVSKYINFGIDYKKLFKGNKNLNNKLKIMFISDLRFHQIGSMNIHHSLYSKSDKELLIIHSNFHSYMCRENGSNFTTNLRHLYIPIDIFNLFSYILDISNLKKYLRNFINLIFVSSFKKQKINPISVNKKSVALFIHQSIYYGQNLFIKDHYFSKNKSSPLHPSNMLIYTNNRNSREKLSGIEFIKVNPKVSVKNIFKSLIFIFLNLKKISNIKNLYGLIYICYMYIKYISWLEYFKDKNISHMIFDYDSMLSKSLALALESLKIKTIALQERPSTSSWSLYGVVVDTYLCGGKLYQEALLKNKYFEFKNCYNMGMWRVSLFYKESLLNIKNTKFLKSSECRVQDFNKKILFLGFFIDYENNDPDINVEAFEDFIDLVIKAAKEFRDAAIIIRMKILNEKDKDFILKKFMGINNIFLSIDYKNLHISYSLSKEADVIVSVPTSIAEESIVYGKKVIFIDTLYPTVNISKRFYLEDFYFCIAKSSLEINKLIYQCFENDSHLSEKYKNLKEKLSGNIDLSKPYAVSNQLQEYLK